MPFKNLVAVIVAFMALTSHADPHLYKIICDPKDLTEGAYARTRTLGKLSSHKEWAKYEFEGEFGMDAVFIRKPNIIGALWWHEGSSVCVKFNKDGMWASTIEGHNISGDWQGPFTYVGRNSEISDIYFDRIFQKECFFDKKAGKKWCFGSNYFKINSKKYKATLQLDQSESPPFGTSVAVTGYKDLFIFYPYNNGWKVFKSAYASEPEYIDIDPNKDSPWAELIPLSAHH